MVLRFGETKGKKENLDTAKRSLKISDANAGNIVISKLVKTKTNSKYLIGCLG